LRTEKEGFSYPVKTNFFLIGGKKEIAYTGKENPLSGL